jgi:hypothetical protein
VSGFFNARFLVTRRDFDHRDDKHHNDPRRQNGQQRKVFAALLSMDGGWIFDLHNNLPLRPPIAD